jgi:putative phosphoesterase
VRIGLISDTHIPRDVEELPPQVKDAFKTADLILHAGDIYLPSVLDELETMAPVLAARGNGDSDFANDGRVRHSHVLDIDGYRLGLIHAMWYTEPSLSALERPMEREFGGHVDIVVFGDTHVALVQRFEGILLMNPEVTEGRVKARIVELGDL